MIVGFSLYSVKKEITEELKVLITDKLWYIWKGRCEVKMGSKQLNVHGVYSREIKATEELLAAKLEKRKKYDEEDSGKDGNRDNKWKCPGEGWIKLNCDEAWKERLLLG